MNIAKKVGVTAKNPEVLKSMTINHSEHGLQTMWS